MGAKSSHFFVLIALAFPVFSAGVGGTKNRSTLKLYYFIVYQLFIIVIDYLIANTFL